jgi:hypothetical protein
VDLGEVAEALYGLPRADFTAARDEQVRAARAAGDKELAARIGKLRRPTVAGWLVNQLARDRPDSVVELAELGAALRTAHENLDGGALRSLSQSRHQLVNELLGVTRELGAEAGQPVGDPVARELEEMFTAALGSAEAARALAGGRVAATKDVADPGSVTWPGVDPGALPEPARPRAPRTPEPVARPEPAAGPGPDPALERARMKARAELDRLTQARDQAESDVTETRRESEDAARAEDAAHRRVAELRAELTVAERDEQRSRESARAARRAAEDADRALRDTRRRQEIAEQRLTALDG